MPYDDTSWSPGGGGGCDKCDGIGIVEGRSVPMLAPDSKPFVQYPVFGYIRSPTPCPHCCPGAQLPGDCKLCMGTGILVGVVVTWCHAMPTALVQTITRACPCKGGAANDAKNDPAEPSKDVGEGDSG